MCDNDGMERRVFRADELVRIDDERFVVIASGGPLMRVRAVEGDNAVCEWQYDGASHRHLFPVVCLRALSRVTPAEAVRLVVVEG